MMGKVEVQTTVSGLDDLVAILQAAIDRLEKIEDRNLPEWVDLETACKFKGITSKTVQNPPNRMLLPPESEKVLVGRKFKWPREVIIAWAAKTDAELERESRQLKRVK